MASSNYLSFECSAEECRECWSEVCEHRCHYHRSLALDVLKILGGLILIGGGIFLYGLTEAGW